jgi:hypothetical protein
LRSRSTSARGRPRSARDWPEPTSIVTSPSRRPWPAQPVAHALLRRAQRRVARGPLAGEAGAPPGASARRTLRAASLLLVLFISRSTSPTGVASSLSSSAWRGRGAPDSRSTTVPRRLPPVSAQRPATIVGAATGTAGAAPSSGARRIADGGLT